MHYKDSGNGLDTAKKILKVNHAVESTVVNHLNDQLKYLRNNNDKMAFQTVNAILADEINHRDLSEIEGGKNSWVYSPMRFLISSFTEIVIRFGMR